MNLHTLSLLSIIVASTITVTSSTAVDLISQTPASFPFVHLARRKKSGGGKAGGGSKSGGDKGGGGTSGIPESCTQRGAEFAKNGLKPDKNGSGRPYLAAMCPGVFRAGGSKAKSTKSSPWEVCGWSMSHGASCQKCNQGQGKCKVDMQLLILHGCRTKFKYEIKAWTENTGHMEARFIKWIKTNGDKMKDDPLAYMEKTCPGVFKKEECGDITPYDACAWSVRKGMECYAKASGLQLSPDADKIVDEMCQTKFQKGKVFDTKAGSEGGKNKDSEGGDGGSGGDSGGGDSGDSGESDSKKSGKGGKKGGKKKKKKKKKKKSK